MPLRLVVGLGNPGPEYAGTRHNVGFRLLDRLRERAGWRVFKGFGEYSESQGPAGKVFWAKPAAYMNESGKALRAFADYFNIPSSEMLVCFDDFSLPLGKIRLRPAGSAGGHNGMQSVIDHLGTERIARLRVGIGPLPQGGDPARFVLDPFRDEEKEALERALERAAGAVLDCIEGSLEAAMNKHNTQEIA